MTIAAPSATNAASGRDLGLAGVRVDADDQSLVIELDTGDIVRVPLALAVEAATRSQIEQQEQAAA